MGIIGAIDVAVGTGATWLVSTATTSLVGGALGGVAHLVSMLATTVLDGLTCIKDSAFGFFIFMALELSMPVVLSFAATALGYLVSIPLALLIGAINTASILGMAYLS